jgi:hypothetical protein
VAEGVVDLLEAVEVEEQHGELALVALRRGDGVAEQLREHRPVGQAGERVVGSEVLDALVGLLAPQELPDLAADDADRLQQARVRLADLPAPEGEHAEETAGGGDREEEAALQSGDLRQIAVHHARVVARIGDPERLAGLPDLSGEPGSGSKDDRPRDLEAMLDRGPEGVPEGAEAQHLVLLVALPVFAAGPALRLADLAHERGQRGRCAVRLRQAARHRVLQAQQALLVLARRDVLDHRDVVQRLAAGPAAHRDRDADPGHRAVLAPVALLQPEGLQLARRQLLPLPVADVAVLGVGDVLDREREQFVARVAEQVAQPLIDVQEAAVEADVGDADRRQLDGALEALLALLQPRLRFRAPAELADLAADVARAIQKPGVGLVDALAEEFDHADDAIVRRDGKGEGAAQAGRGGGVAAPERRVGEQVLHPHRLAARPGAPPESAAAVRLLPAVAVEEAVELGRLAPRAYAGDRAFLVLRRPPGAARPAQGVADRLDQRRRGVLRALELAQHARHAVLDGEALLDGDSSLRLAPVHGSSFADPYASPAAAARTRSFWQSCLQSGRADTSPARILPRSIGNDCGRPKPPASLAAKLPVLPEQVLRDACGLVHEVA